MLVWGRGFRKTMTMMRTWVAAMLAFSSTARAQWDAGWGFASHHGTPSMQPSLQSYLVCHPYPTPNPPLHQIFFDKNLL